MNESTSACGPWGHASSGWTTVPPADRQIPHVAEQPGPSGPVAYLEIPGWRARFGVTAGITTRAAGQDFGLFGPAPAGEVTVAWLALLAGLGPAAQALALSKQVHGTAIRSHQGASSGLLVGDAADGHYTGQPGMFLAITVADCVPVYLLAPPAGAVALLHAGWRGVAGGIVEAGVHAMVEAGQVRPRDIVMHCGVAICGSCYEVGPEVLQAVQRVAATHPQGLDLRAAVADRARREGLTEITLSSWCTAHDRDRFYSHRRSAGSDGRLAAFVGRPGA